MVAGNGGVDVGQPLKGYGERHDRSRLRLTVLLEALTLNPCKARGACRCLLGAVRPRLYSFGR